MGNVMSELVWYSKNVILWGDVQMRIVVLHRKLKKQISFCFWGLAITMAVSCTVGLIVRL